MGSQRQLFLTWLPTAFGASMLSLEMPAVVAAVARSADGGEALAAMGICIGVLVVINTPALAMTALVVTEAGRQPARRLKSYTACVGALGSLALLTVSVTGVGFLELDPGLDRAVRAGLLGLVPNSAAVALRRYLHGRLIHAGHTRPITAATIVRIVGSGAFAWIGVAILPEHGALVGGLALSAGAFIEAALLGLAVRRVPPLPVPAGNTGSRSGVVRRHGQLSLARLLIMAPPSIALIGIAHGADAALSLVVWPAVFEMVALFTAPTADWESVAATELRRQPGDRTPARLTGWLAAGFTAAFGLAFVLDLDQFFVRTLIGVPPEPAELGLRWLPLLLPVPALWLLRGYLRGVAMAKLSTGGLAWAGVAHLAVLVAAVAGLSRTALPGVAVACAAILAGLLAECTVNAITASLTASTPIAARTTS